MSHALKAAIEEAAKAAAAIADRAVAENRELTETEQAEFTALFEKARDTKRTLMGFAERKSQLADIAVDLGVDDDEPPQPEISEQRRASTGNSKSGRYPNKSGAGSLGKQFVESDQYQSMLHNAPGGRFSEKSRVQSHPYQIKQTSLITGADDTSAGALVTPQDNGMLAPYYARPLTIRQLVTNGRTNSDAIEFVRMINTVNNAAPVAEALTDADIDPAGTPPVTAAAGGQKPQSALEFERDSTTVKTIAHYMAATKRSLSDAAQIQTLIDTFLRSGLQEELEDQMIAGDGTGENFLGLNNTSGIQTDTGVGSAVTGVEAMRRARRKVQIGGRTVPTGYAMNPLDWEKIELLKDTQGRFYGNGPFALGPKTLWGLPVVESEALPAGTAYCADWRQAVLYDREEATITVTDSHKDWFARNLVAILGELRAAFIVLRPPAFCKVTLT